MKNKFVSIVMPVYNEELYIANCIESLLLQDYPKESMEWIFVDGMSTDNTCAIISNYIKQYPKLIKLKNNEKRTVPYAMNIGIKEAMGEYIIRLDAHAEYSTDYISKCVYYLETTEAANVGGVAETRGRSKAGKTIAKMLSSSFGVGNSKFRTNGESGFVDTVPFGAFRREVFEKWGGYDERLTRNQDNEMNYRIRKNGGKIYLASDIKFAYYCRDSVKGIANMAIQNGIWNVITMRLCPGSMGIRHFVPCAFLLSLIILPIIGALWAPFWWLLFAEIAAYLLLDFFVSGRLADNVREFLMLSILFPTFHLAYGLGSILGIARLFSKEFRSKEIG